jgi:tyrosyl-tRNA synthetase
LNREFLTEYDYWQFWRNTADADVIRFLKLFTELPMGQIREYEKLEGSALNDIKKILADEATKLLHGEECLGQIHATIGSLFGKKVMAEHGGEDLSSLPQIPLVDEDFKLDNAAGVEVVQVVELLVKAGLTSSRSEARRLIKAGGVKLNDLKVEDEFHVIQKNEFDRNQGRLKLSSGKKKHVVLVWSSSVNQ